MIKVSHLKPSGNYMYHKLQHYESLHFATQSICVFIVVWTSVQIILLNSIDWLVCIRSKMFSEVSCVIQKHVCPLIKYIYIYLTKTKTLDRHILFLKMMPGAPRWEHWGWTPRQPDCQLQSNFDWDIAFRGSIGGWNLTSYCPAKYISPVRIMRFLWYIKF